MTKTNKEGEKMRIIIAVEAMDDIRLLHEVFGRVQSTGNRQLTVAEQEYAEEQAMWISIMEKEILNRMSKRFL